MGRGLAARAGRRRGVLILAHSDLDLRTFHELQLREMRVEAILAQQRLVRADRVDASALEHDDAVGVAHGGEAMGDDERRAAAREMLEGLRDLALAFGVERARRFVEQQDRAVGEERARDRDALPLAAGELDAALAEVVSILRQLPESSRRAPPAQSASACLIHGRPKRTFPSRWSRRSPDPAHVADGAADWSGSQCGAAP